MLVNWNKMNINKVTDLLGPLLQSSPVPSRGLAEDVAESWEHHLGHHPSLRQGGSPGPRGGRVYATRQNLVHVMKYASL